MVKRSYSGPAIDDTWQDFEDRPRPYNGRGETVEVIDDRINAPAPADDAVTVPADFHLSSAAFETYRTLESVGEATIRDLADRVGITAQAVRQQIGSLEDAGLIDADEGAGAYGAAIFRITTPPDSRFWFSDGVSSDLLPSNVHPLRIPPMRRRILAYAARNPTRTQSEIAEEFDTSQGFVSLTFSEIGDPRRDIDTREIQGAKLSLYHTNRRLDELESQIADLESERADLLDKREWLVDRLSAKNRLSNMNGTGTRNGTPSENWNGGSSDE